MTGRLPTITEPELRVLLRQGCSTAEIAAHFGVQSPAVTRACHRFGLSLPAIGRGLPQGRADAEPSRAEDERLLGWIADRVAGEPVAAIARRAGVTPSVVQAKTSAVRDADLAESGEPPLVVGRAYLWSRA